jgi:hypothetical protein
MLAEITSYRPVGVIVGSVLAPMKTKPSAVRWVWRAAKSKPWTEEGLGAAVDAYLEMQAKARRGERVIAPRLRINGAAIRKNRVDSWSVGCCCQAIFEKRRHNLCRAHPRALPNQERLTGAASGLWACWRY